MIKLKIASPEQTLFDGETSQVTIKTIDGVITVLPNHIPLVSIIEDGYVQVPDNEIINVKKGFVTVNKNSSIDILISVLEEPQKGDE